MRALQRSKRCTKGMSFISVRQKRHTLVFGRVSAGIPEEILAEHWEHTVRIPMQKDARSLNLSNAAAVVAYEAMRQVGFANLAEEGPGLRRWK